MDVSPARHYALRPVADLERFLRCAFIGLVVIGNSNNRHHVVQGGNKFSAFGFIRLTRSNSSFGSERAHLHRCGRAA
jgi:DNA integrity scanning protein DisA with diadenylate cyclase activity